MTLNPLWRRSSIACALTLLAAPASAADMTKSECVDAKTNAQSLRRDGKLTEARKLLSACGAPSCPRIVRSDCTRRPDEVESAQPTILFDVRAAAGGDLSDVKITIDGRPSAQTLDGTALEVNPGEHVFSFEVPGQPVVTEKLVLKESEKSRRERVVVGTAPAPLPPGAPVAAHLGAPPPPAADAAHVQASGGPGSRRIVGLTLVGVAGVDVGWILFFTGGKEAPRSSATLSITPALGPGRVGLEGRF